MFTYQVAPSGRPDSVKVTSYRATEVEVNGTGSVNADPATVKSPEAGVLQPVALVAAE